MSSRRSGFLSGTAVCALLAGTAFSIVPWPTPATAATYYVGDTPSLDDAIDDANNGGSPVTYVSTSFNAVNPIALNASLPIFLQTYALGVTGLSGTGLLSVVSNGAGTLNLTGTNTFNGTISVDTSTITADSDAALGAPGTTLSLNSATLRLTGGVTSSRPIQINAMGATVDTDVYDLTHSGLISGSSRLFKIGHGMLVLRGTNISTGGITVIDGIVIAEGTGTLGTGPVYLGGGTLQLMNGFNANALQIQLNSGYILTYDTSSLGNATLTTASGIAYLNNSSTAANAVITNNSGGTTSFQDGSTAGSSTITTNAGGLTEFWGWSTGGNARLIVNSGGTVDFSGSSGPGFDRKLTVGSIEGAGAIRLGANELTVGGNGLSTQVTGAIQDGGNGGGSGGSLVKTGGGTLTLGGVNTYTGGTTLLGGVLQVSSDASLGAASGGLTFNGGTLRAAGSFSTNRAVSLQAGNGRFDVGAGQLLALGGTLMGSGGFGKEGSGTLRLDRANGYTGGTQIFDGDILVNADGALGSGPVLIDGSSSNLWFGSGTGAGTLAITTNNGRLYFQPTATAASATVTNTGGSVFFIGGSTAEDSHITNRLGGSVLFEGTATAQNAEFDSAGTSAATASGVFFQGQSTAGTSHFVSGTYGHVTFTDQSSAERATIVNNAGGTVYFADDSTANLVAITNNPGGAIDVSGHNGSLTIGSVTGAGDIFLGRNALILGANGMDSVLDGDLHDGGYAGGTGGSLVKTGAGTLDLRGESTFTGPTLVQSGRLKVNGSLASSVQVSDGATLGGSGEIAGFAAQSGATIAPGNSIGTLQVAGNVAFAAGSNYQVEINAAGQSDSIAATGHAALSGGSVQVLPDQGTGYMADKPYTILTAQGGVSGAFVGTSGGPFAFVTPTLGYGNDAVTLTLVRKVNPPEPSQPSAPTPVAFNSVATTRNASSTANAVEALGAGNPLHDIILGASVSGARQAFTALSGESHASAATSAYGDARLVQNTILSHLRRPLESHLPTFAQGPYRAAYAAYRPGTQPQPVAVAPELDPRRFALWGEGYGSWGRTGSNGNAASLSASTGGFIVGADAQVDPAFRVGLAGGFTSTTFDTRGGLSSGSNDSIFAAAYATGDWGPFNLRLGASYASHDIDTRRTIAFPGFNDLTTASYDGSTVEAFGELGYRVGLGRVQFEPFIGAAALRLHTDGFQENGGAAALIGYGHTDDLATTTLGLRMEARLIGDLPLTLRGMLGWRHAYGDLEPATQLSFNGGASAFTVAGAPIDRNAAVVEAGLDWHVTEAIDLGVSYAGQIGERAQDHALKGSFIWRFGTR